MKNDYKKLGKNTAVLTIGNFSSKILNYLLVPLYTYALTTSQYGTIEIINTTVMLLLPILSLSVGEAIMRFALDKDIDKSLVFSFGLLISCASCVIFIMLCPIFVMIPVIKDFLFMFIGVFVSQVFVVTIGQFAKGCEKVKVYTIASVIQTVTFLFCNILFLIVWHMGIVGFLLANILANVMNIIIIVGFANVGEYVRPIHKNDLKNIKKMISYSFPLIPNNISWWINNSSDKYILSFFWGTSIVGMYSTAYKIPSIMQAFISIFWSAWQISAVEDFGSKSSIKFFSDIYKLLSSTMIIVCAFVITFSEQIASFAFQKDFFEAWKYAPILVFSFVFSGMSSFLGTIYTSAKKTRSVFISTSIGAVINIFLNIILIPKFGGYGAAVATFISYFAMWGFRVIDSRKIIWLEIDLKKDLLNYFLSLALIIGILYLVGRIKVLFVCVCLAGIIFNERTYMLRMLNIAYEMVNRVIFRKDNN